MPTFARVVMYAVRALVFAPLLAVAGCAVVVTADGDRLRPTSARFRTYVETVFREQNRVADELAFAFEDRTDAPPALAAAEDALGEACAGVNELAAARRDDRGLGLRRSAALAGGVPQCEQAARAAAAALETTR